MSNPVPTDPESKTMIIGGVTHSHPSASPLSYRRYLDDFLTPALHYLDLQAWPDCGAEWAMMVALDDWWPEPECPVYTRFTKEDGSRHDRWVGLHILTKEELQAKYPQDKADLEDYHAWSDLMEERYHALQPVRKVSQEMGKVRYAQVLRQVVADLEANIPGYVGQLVQYHLANCKACAGAEHYVKIPAGG